MSFEEASKALNKCLTAIIASNKAAKEARELVRQAELHNEECQHWLKVMRNKQLLFQKGVLN